MGKIENSYRTIDDPIVVEGLCAISQLEKENFSRGSWFVVGGIAVQSYLPTSCRRSTSDIDLALLLPLNYSEFRSYSNPVREYLQDLGFSVTETKGHNAYILTYENKDNESYAIEFARRSKANIERIKKRLEDELSQTRLKIVEGRKESFRVSSPEDIVAPKIVRGITFLEEFPEFTRYVYDTYPLTEEKITKEKEEIERIRREAVLLGVDYELVSRVRFLSDIYDIKVLAELTGFNADYLRESLRRWNKIEKNSEEKRLLISRLLPFIRI